MRKNGFTLIELLVVAAIIAGLVGTVAIIVPKMQERARQRNLGVNDPGVIEQSNEALKKSSAKAGHSYVPVDCDGTIAANNELLLQVMADFEKKNPEFELYDVDVVSDQLAYTTRAHIYGIWFHYHIKAEASTYDGK